MRVLIIKTSSLGDVIHALPALTDARTAIPEISFDWVVEENYAAIPAWHHAVNQIIPVALRRWRKTPFSPQTRQQWREFKTRLAANNYDIVIDAQGLFKSAWLTRTARGRSHGYDRRSAREGLAAFCYDQTHSVSRQQHAIERVRQLFAKALDYPLPDTAPEYGITVTQTESTSRQLVFLHSTTWQSKHWPPQYWQEMIELAANNAYQVQLPWGNDEEKLLAQKLAQANKNAQVSPAMDLNGMASLLASASGAVAVDTGLGHLAAALSLPTVSIYGSTDPLLTGSRGKFQSQLQAEFSCSPCLQRQCSYTRAAPVSPACYQTTKPENVWQQLESLIKEKNND